MKKIFVLSFVFWFLISGLLNDSCFCQSQPQVQVTKDKTLQYAKPKKPLKIKLSRDKNGEYRWDITGENVDDVVRADKRLRQLLLKEE